MVTRKTIGFPFRAPSTHSYPPAGGLGGSGGSSYASTFRLNFSGLKVNPKTETKYFSISNSANLTIYIQQPTENTRKKIGDNSVGHAFIGLEQRTLKRYLGFYLESPNASLISNQTSEIHDNSNEMYHVSISISINISPDKMSSVIIYINNYNEKYDLNNFNCIDFVIGVAEKAGLNLPKTTGEHSELIFKSKGRNPGDLGQDVRTMNLPNGVTRTTTKSTSGSKQGGSKT